MGGKQWKDRQYILFYHTCILVILLMTAGCVNIMTNLKKSTAKDSLELAENMLSKGNYDDALKTYREVRRTYPKNSPGDRALFDMGIIWAYPDNPKKDYEKALIHFRQLPIDYPKSSLKEEARAWAAAMNKIIRYAARIKDLEGKITSCKEQFKELKEKEETQASAAAIDKTIRNEDRIKDLESKINFYKEQLKELKEIDIGTEKMREGTPGN